jgi:hypothetical protein
MQGTLYRIRERINRRWKLTYFLNPVKHLLKQKVSYSPFQRDEGEENALISLISLIP